MRTAGCSPALYAGIGCRRGCPASALGDLLHQALDAHGLPLAALKGLASIDLKSDEVGLRQLADELGLPLVFFNAAQLAPFEAQLSHRSTTTWRHSGCWGVAESAALAMATRHEGHAILQAPRRVQGQATLALACGTGFDG